MGASHGAEESCVELSRMLPLGEALCLSALKSPKAKLESTASPRDGGKPEGAVESDRGHVGDEPMDGVK